MSYTQDIGSKLKQFLLSRNIKPHDLAQKIAVDSSLIRKWLAGTRVPSLKSPYYDLLCDYLNLNQSEKIILKNAQINSLDENSIRLADLQRAEQRATENEQAMFSLLNAITEAAILVDSEGRIFATNKIVAERFGISLSELLGQCLYDFFSLKDSEKQKKVIAQVFCTGESAVFKENNNERCVLYSLYPAKDCTGQVTKVAIVGIDLTEMEHTLTVLRESEERHRLLFQYSLDPVLLTEPDGKILAANPAACSFFQMSEKEICDRGRNGIMDTSDQQLEPALLKRRLTGKAQAVLGVVKGDGSKSLADITSMEFRNSKNKLESYVIIRPLAGKEPSNQTQ